MVLSAPVGAPLTAPVFAPLPVADDREVYTGPVTMDGEQVTVGGEDVTMAGGYD